MDRLNPNTKKLLLGAAAIIFLLFLVSNSSPKSDTKTPKVPNQHRPIDNNDNENEEFNEPPTSGKYYAERSQPDWVHTLMPIVIVPHVGNPPYKYSLPRQQLHAAQWEKPVTIGNYHNEFQGMMRKFPEDTIMLDVGANVGLSALPVAAMGHTVVAFEPVPANWRKLQESIAANGFENRLHLYPVAVGDERKTLTFYVPQGNEDNTASTKDGALTNVNNPVDEIQVKVESIDRFLEEHPEYDVSKIRFMKIDTQGFEEFVLKGARNFLQTQRDQLVVQAELASNIIHRVGLKPISVLEFMDEMGYDVYAGNSKIPPSNFQSFLSGQGSNEMYYCKKGRHFEF